MSSGLSGFTPRIAHQANQWETGIALVSAGFSVCVVSRLSRWPDLHPVARVPLSGDHTPSRRSVAITRAGAEEQQPLPFAISELRCAVGSLPGPHQR